MTGGARSGESRTQDRTPDVEDDRKPDSPTDLTRRSWAYVVRKTMREFGDDQCTDLAAALTYYAVLALFPAAIALISLLGVVGQGQSSVDNVITVLTPLVSPSTLDTVQPALEHIATSQSAGLGLVLGIVGALWSASGYVGAFGRAMNAVYEIDEGRPFWKLRPVMLLVTLVAILLVAVVLVMLIVSGPLASSIGSVLGLSTQAVTVWNIVKWPVIVLFVVLIVAILYYTTPNVKQPKFRWLSIGAIVAILVWIVASAAFAFYVVDIRELRQDLRLARRSRGRPAVALDHQPGAPVRSRAGLRARARPPAAGRHRGRGGAATARPRHARHHEGAQEGAEGPGRGRAIREEADETDTTTDTREKTP